MARRCSAPGGVLRPDHRGQVDKLAGLLQLRQHEVLLQLLVVALDEAADDTRRAGDDVDIGSLRFDDVGGEAARRLVIDDQ